jgi:hypothetical protein
MSSALSVIAVFSVVAFLGGAACGMLALISISIHRTRHAPFSDVRSERAGCISRRVLTGERVTRREPGE